MLDLGVFSGEIFESGPGLLNDMLEAGHNDNRGVDIEDGLDDERACGGEEEDQDEENDEGTEVDDEVLVALTGAAAVLTPVVEEAASAGASSSSSSTDPAPPPLPPPLEAPPRLGYGSSIAEAFKDRPTVGLICKYTDGKNVAAPCHLHPKCAIKCGIVSRGVEYNKLARWLAFGQALLATAFES